MPKTEVIGGFEFTEVEPEEEESQPKSEVIGGYEFTEVPDEEEEADLELAKPVYRPKRETSPAVKSIRRRAADTRAKSRYLTGRDGELTGNTIINQAVLERAEAEELFDSDEPMTDEERDLALQRIARRDRGWTQNVGLGTEVAEAARNVPREIREFVTGISDIIAEGVEAYRDEEGEGVMAAFGDWLTTPQSETIRYQLPGGETRDLVLPSKGELTQQQKQEIEQLNRLGAFVLSRQAGETGKDILWKSLKEEGSRMAGIYRFDDIQNREFYDSQGRPVDVESFQIPGTDLAFVPRFAYEASIEQPVSRVLDATMVAALPSTGARGLAAAERTAAKAIEKTAGKGAARNLVESSLKWESRADKWQVGPLMNEGVRSVLARTDKGAELLHTHDAKVFAKRLVNAERGLEPKLVQDIENNISTALRGLDEEALTMLPDYLEGTVIRDAMQGKLGPEKKAAFDRMRESEPFKRAVRVVNSEIRRLEAEKIRLGLLDETTADVRRYAPLAVTNTGKRIPDRDWDNATINARNAKIEEWNASHPDAAYPTYMTREEWAHSLETAKRDFDEIRQVLADDLSEPLDKVLPTYFPRYSRGGKAGDVDGLVKSLFTRSRKMPEEAHFSGLSILKESTNVTDLKQHLTRHGKRVERLLALERTLQDLKRSDYAKPVKLRFVEGKGGKELRPVLEGAEALESGYVLVNADALRVAAHNQLLFDKRMGAALENGLSAPEAARAAGESVRTALQRAFDQDALEAAKGKEVVGEFFQVPKGIMEQVTKGFSPVSNRFTFWADTVTDVFKNSVLVWSPKWYINNFVGNFVMTAASAGLKPAASYLYQGGKQLLTRGRTGMARYVDEAGNVERRTMSSLSRSGLTTADLRSQGMRPVLPRELQGSTSVAELGDGGRRIASSEFAGVPENLWAQAGKSWATAGPLREQVRTKLLNFQEAADDFARANVYKTVAERAARRKLMEETGSALISSRDLLRKMADFAEDPEMVQKLLRETDRAYLNFNNMRPGEREFIRRALPFWSWMREQARLVATLPGRAPWKVQALHQLQEMASMADEEEVNVHLGISKKQLPQYFEGKNFLTVNADGQVVLMGINGANVFYGVPVGPDDFLGALSPAIKWAIGELTGTRSFGVWGRSVPLDFAEGEWTAKGAAQRLIRSHLPPVVLMEDLAQYATERVISRRYDDRTPLGTLVDKVQAKVTGDRSYMEESKRTGIFSPDQERYKNEQAPLAPVLRQFGVNLTSYDLEEWLEMNIERGQKEVADQVRVLLRTNPEAQAMLREEVLKRPGLSPKFAGIASLDAQNTQNMLLNQYGAARAAGDTELMAEIERILIETYGQEWVDQNKFVTRGSRNLSAEE